MAKRKAIPAETQPTDAASAGSAEGYTVLARRYRPQQFNDLVGQEAVAQALVNALESNRVAHAYLFTGARGVGKTSTARILAKAMNCVNGPTATPCDQCEICQGIASGEDVDVLEIDAASNRGIDEVREIRQNVQYRPTRCRYKIYIIDEVHMLTTQAFNALLKTLEEPPPHVKFILATTEVQKIPITILSRCQRFDFAGIGTDRIVQRLREVVAAENLQADDEALEMIARRAEGSMRDAQSLLDQLLAFGGDRLTSDQVHQLLGTAHNERIQAIASAVLEHDPKKALAILGEAAEQGIQLPELLNQLMDYWRDLMVVHCAGEAARNLSVAPRHREVLQKQAGAMKLDTILAGLDVLGTTKFRLRGSSQARIWLETALVRLGRLDDLVSLSQLGQWLNQPQSVSGNPGRTGKAPLPPSASLPEVVKKKSSLAPEVAAGPVRLPLDDKSLNQIWQGVLQQVGSFLASDLARAGIPAISGPNTLVLCFPPDYNLSRENCQRPASVTRVEEALRKITGQSCSLRIESSGEATNNSQQSSRAEETETAPSRYRRQRTEAMREPLVKRAMDLLGAQLVEMDEGFGTGAGATELSESTDSEES